MLPTARACMSPPAHAEQKTRSAVCRFPNSDRVFASPDPLLPCSCISGTGGEKEKLRRSERGVKQKQSRASRFKAEPHGSLGSFRVILAGGDTVILFHASRLQRPARGAACHAGWEAGVSQDLMWRRGHFSCFAHSIRMHGVVAHGDGSTQKGTYRLD